MVSYFKYIYAAMSFIPTLVNLVETFNTEPSNGKKKKRVVIDVLRLIFDAVSQVVTGGARDTFKMIEPMVDAAIEAAVMDMKVDGSDERQPLQLDEPLTGVLPEIKPEGVR